MNQAPLYYWLPWPWCYPVLYGYDYGMYVHFTPEETPTYLETAFVTLLSAVITWQNIATLISFPCIVASIFRNPVTSLVLAATSLIIAGLGLSATDLANKIWNDISGVAALNAQEDPSYGFQLFQRFHWVASYCWYDPLTWTTFHIIYYNGVVLQTCPRTGVSYMDGTSTGAYLDFLWWYSSNIGFNHWIWVSMG